MSKNLGDKGHIAKPLSSPPTDVEDRAQGNAGQKAFTSGTHRSRPPTETLAIVTPHLAEMGITRVANVTGLDRIGLPVVAVYRPNARSVVVAQGKGLDLDAAKASGIMEAIESDHAERPDVPLRLSTEADLHRLGYAIADTARLPRLSVSRYDPFQPILWCMAEDLMANSAPLAVPYDLVHTNFTHPLPAGSGHFQMSSNGLASGNTRLEAICHGACEVIERDAQALWLQRGGTRNAHGHLNLDTVDHPAAQRVIRRLTEAGLIIGVWDMTTDIGLPAFMCLTVDREAGAFRPAYISQGSGCHPARAVALCRALTEAAQTRLTYIAGTRDDANREFFESARNPDRATALRQELDTANTTQGQAYGDGPDHDTTRFEADLDLIKEGLAAAGLHQLAVVEIPSRIDGIAIVRVIIPGLEGLSEAPGYIRGSRALAMAERYPQANGGRP